jgi:hypothetical protein
MNRLRKITVVVPEDLLRKAQQSTGTGMAETVRAGLNLLVASEAYARIRAMRGKVCFSCSAAELKADRQ